jgi:hypothetical protein
MDTSLFILVSDDYGHLEVDGRLDLFAALLSVLSGERSVTNNPIRVNDDAPDQCDDCLARGEEDG